MQGFLLSSIKSNVLNQGRQKKILIEVPWHLFGGPQDNLVSKVLFLFDLKIVEFLNSAPQDTEVQKKTKVTISIHLRQKFFQESLKFFQNKNLFWSSSKLEINFQF